MFYTIKQLRAKILDGSIYKLQRYRTWRTKVYKRDGFKCKWCGAKDVPLQGHHILTKYSHPRLIFKVSNGITLCEECHKKVYKQERKYAKLFKKLIKKGKKKDGSAKIPKPMRFL